jgi:hypothetical protein
MADLPESITMSTSGSADTALDNGVANSGSGQTGNAYLEAALLKLRQGGHNTAALPRSINDNLWEQYQSTFELTLVEMTALKNHACPVVGHSIFKTSAPSVPNFSILSYHNKSRELRMPFNSIGLDC